MTSTKTKIQTYVWCQNSLQNMEFKLCLGWLKHLDNIKLDNNKVGNFDAFSHIVPPNNILFNTCNVTCNVKI